MKEVEVSLAVSVFKEGETFIAYTPALDLSTAGASLAEAKQHFAEAVRIFFAELGEAGTTEEVLTALGWEEQQSWIPPVEVEHSTQTFNVPV